MQIGWLEILKVRSSQGCVSSRLVLDRLQVGARIWVLWRPGSVGPGRHSDRAQHGAQRSKEAQVGSPASEGMAGVAIEEEGGFLEHVSLFPALASNKCVVLFVITGNGFLESVGLFRAVTPRNQF